MTHRDQRAPGSEIALSSRDQGQVRGKDRPGNEIAMLASEPTAWLTATEAA